MHATDTIGVEVTLRPGDTVVQNGTRHRWKNPGTPWCRLPSRLARQATPYPDGRTPSTATRPG
jgi:hypothetical protein